MFAFGVIEIPSEEKLTVAELCQISPSRQRLHRNDRATTGSGVGRSGALDMS